MPCGKRELVQIVYEYGSVFYYFSLLSVGYTCNCSRLFVAASSDVGCKLHHGAFSFAHYNIVYLWMLQHAVRLVGGVPPADHNFAGRKRLFNSCGWFNASAGSC